jgi:RecA/RadA recombinase
MLSYLAAAVAHAAARLSELPGAQPPGAEAAAGEAAHYGPARQLEALGETVAMGLWHLLLATALGWAAAVLMRTRAAPARPAAVVLCLLVLIDLAGFGGLLGDLPLIGSLGAPALILAAAVAVRTERRWERAAAEEFEEAGILAAASARAAPKPGVARLLAGVRETLGVLAGRMFTGRDGRERSGPRTGEGRCDGCSLAGTLIPVLARARRSVVRLAARLAAGRTEREVTVPAGSLLLGQEVGSRGAVGVPLGHAVVVGATGSGKTVTLRRIVASATPHMGVVAVDGKGDPALERDLERLAGATGRRFVAWSPGYGTRYSPFSHGADTEIVDKALAAQAWGDEYYLRLGQRFLGFAVRALRAAGGEPTLAALARYADPAALDELAPAIEARAPGGWNELLGALPRLGPAERQAIAGTQHRLAAMAESDVGHLLEPAAGHETLDLSEMVREGGVAYLNLSADARPELSRMLGAAIVLDLVSIAAEMQAHRRAAPTLALLDDVQAFATPACMRGIASLTARGRSAGIMLLLGTQALGDLRMAPGEGPAEQILGNRAALVVHRLPGWESAAQASRELGDRPAQLLGERMEGGPGRWRSAGMATRTTGQVPNVLPRELMQLPTGVAVLGTAAGRPRLVRVLPTA